MADRVTQQLVVTAYNTNPEARVTSVTAESLIKPTAPTARVTGVYLEALTSVAGTGGGGGGGSRVTMFVIAGS